MSFCAGYPQISQNNAEEEVIDGDYLKNSVEAGNAAGDGGASHQQAPSQPLPFFDIADDVLKIGEGQERYPSKLHSM